MTWRALYRSTVEDYAYHYPHEKIDFSFFYTRTIPDDELIDYIDEIVTDEDVDDFIDEQGTVEILGTSYNPSYILKQIDSITWSMARDDFVTFAVQDIKYERPPRPLTWSDAIIWHGIYWVDDDDVGC